MAWYRLDATEGLDEHLLEDCWRLCRDLTCAGADAKHACAIFERVDGVLRSFYFTPSVGLLAAKLGAQRCPQPSPDGLFLLHGEAPAWRVHFPELVEAHTGHFESTYRLAL
jgi:hypothetical protein